MQASQGVGGNLSVLLKVSSALASTLDLDTVLQIAIEHAVEALAVDTGAIYTLEHGRLYLGATTPPLPPAFPEELRRAQLGDHPHISRSISGRAPVYLEDARNARLTPAEWVVVEARHLVSILYFPLLLKDEAIGAFIVGTMDAVRQFSAEQIDLCYILSGLVSLAVANARLYRIARQAYTDLTRAYDDMLESWSSVLEMRDHATDEHTRRVADLTVALAVRVGVPQSELSHIRRGALLHDIGKMAVPDAILRKPGPLSAEEWAVMRTHPEKARQLLSRIDYLAPAMDIPYCHHERWDGSGYPRGLRGEQIPLTAQLFAVVDVFDALTSDRPYRPAWSRPDALRYLREQSGRLFSPEAVRAFLEMAADMGW